MSQREARQREADYRITLGELREVLRGYPDSAEVTFGSTMAGVPLIFFRVKHRGNNPTTGN